MVVRAGLAGLAAIATTGCAALGMNAELSREDACREHFKNDPARSAACSSNNAGREGDLRPQDLPIPTEPR